MTSIIGRVDGPEGRYITGWAIKQPDTSPCKVRLITSDGKILGSGKAHIPRPDLSKLGLGRTNFSFRIPIPEVTGPLELRVFVGELELPGSPIRFALGNYDGCMEVSNGLIKGWVYEPGRAASAPLVSLLGPYGKVFGTVQSHPEPDGDPMFSPGYFAADLPASCFGRSEVEIHARAGNMIFASTRAAASLRGYLDILTPSRCAGWLMSPDVPHRRFEIAVFRDGKEIARGICRDRREDLIDLFPDSFDTGFDIEFEKPHRAASSLCEISFRLAGTDVELFEGPFIAGHRAGLISATRDAAKNLFDKAHTEADRAILRAAFRRFAEAARAGADYTHLPLDRPAEQPRRLAVLIPIYKGTAVTRACIESVLRVRNPETDRVLLLNDASPEPDMAALLASFAEIPNVTVISNGSNQGFVRTVNRGLGFLCDGDVVLLNSDTILFAGALDELWRAAHSSPGIGTATALSNNATIFSYPHPDLVTDLADATWEELAAAARRENAGQIVDVPTGHGFCMLIKRELLNRLRGFDEAFGRGYGEENEFCFRAADLGYRHVAATGALVQHLENISFGAEKAALMAKNLALLNGKYPEYTPLVMAFEAADPLRTARWALDSFRLRRAAAARRFALVVQTWLGGGTPRAISDIEESAGYGAEILRLIAREDGMLELTAPDLKLRAVFQPNETDPLFNLLIDAGVRLVVVHQLLGYGAAFIARLTAFAADRHVVAFVHDFYAACPRVTLIDPTGRFCGVAEAETCGRCVALGGAHDASRLNELDPARHRSLFGAFFAACRHVVAPSRDTARHFCTVFPDIAPVVVPHLHLGGPPAPARAAGNDIALLGAIGAHKGSALLLEVARLARLTNPELRFHVIGYTDIDAALLKLGNVSITGKYAPADLPSLLDNSRAGIALFLHGWPETFSYTLTEAVMHGLLPLVPDIGAPADRVRASGIGAAFPFPATPAEILTAIGDLQAAGPAEITKNAFTRFTGATKPVDLSRLFTPPKASTDAWLEVDGASN
jgi:GT2 family glycosyltransferase